jgi:hypothetical protein
MIVYYKECPRCYKLLPNNIPMTVRDTNTTQVVEGHGEPIYLVEGDTLGLFHSECIR